MKAKQRKFCSKQSFLKSRLSSTCPSPQMWGRRKIARKGYFSSGSRAVQCNSSNLTLLSSGTRLYQVQCTCAAVLTCRAECSSMNYMWSRLAEHFSLWSTFLISALLHASSLVLALHVTSMWYCTPLPGHRLKSVFASFAAICALPCTAGQLTLFSAPVNIELSTSAVALRTHFGS